MNILGFVITIGTIAAIYGILVLALNVQYGFTGLVNFGIAGFFAVGAYTSGLITLPPPAEVGGALQDHYILGWDAPFLAGFVGAVIVSGLIGALVAYPAVRVRLQGVSLGISTLAFAEIVAIVLSSTDLANGWNGLRGIDRPLYDTITTALGNKVYPSFYLLFSLLVLGLIYWFLRRLERAPFGRILKAIREDEDAVEGLGINTVYYKVMAFAIGCAIAGAAGSLWAHYIRSIQPQTFTAFETFTVWVALIVGGKGNNLGAVMGSFLIIGVFEQVTRFIPGIPGYPSLVPALRQIIIGLLFILMLRYRKQGLIAEKKISYAPPKEVSREFVVAPSAGLWPEKESV